MKIINAHVHLIELQKMLQQNPDMEISLELEVFKNLDQTLSLLEPRKLFEQMDEAGVGQAVLFACEAPIVYSSNEYVAALCRQFPDRLIGFASVNPLRDDAADVIEHAVTHLGLKGIKFHPPLQDFYPDDERVFPVYERAVELNVPAVFHVGTTPFGAMAKLDQANPLLLDTVACAFPDLRIMLTHLGTLWHNEAFMVTEKNRNVFIDTAAYLYEIRALLNNNLIERLGADKFIFGTDYPMPFGNQSHRMKDFVDCVASLDIAEDIKEKIFFRNFAVLMNGREHKTLTAGQMMQALGGGAMGAGTGPGS
jgi:predicted TIM-barrel fold metal-dependent hydrolase